MSLKTIFSIFSVLLLSSCLARYIPFVNDANYNEVIAEGRKAYPEMFRIASEAEKMGYPAFFISLDESSDMSEVSYYEAANEIRENIALAGFPIAEQEEEANIIIKGHIKSVLSAYKDYGGFLDYKASGEIIALKQSNKDELSSFTNKVSGLGLTAEDAARAALANNGREAAKHILKDIISKFRANNIVHLEIYNLQTLPELDSFYLKLKNIKGVSNAWLLDYRGTNAYFDVFVDKGGAGNLARGLMETFGMDLKINRPSLMELTAAVQIK